MRILGITKTFKFDVGAASDLCLGDFVTDAFVIVLHFPAAQHQCKMQFTIAWTPLGMGNSAGHVSCLLYGHSLNCILMACVLCSCYNSIHLFKMPTRVWVDLRVPRNWHQSCGVKYVKMGQLERERTQVLLTG